MAFIALPLPTKSIHFFSTDADPILMEFSNRPRKLRGQLRYFLGELPHPGLSYD